MLDVRLTPAQERLVDQVRQWLEALQAALVELKATAEDQEALDQSLRQLDDFFLLVVVGEFNAGKSAFINALLGHPLLEEGVTPTTRAIHLLRYGEEPDRTFQDGLWIQTAPLDLLRTIHIVDTPGTNAVLREHEAITEAFVPRSDLVLFVTSADRPFTESERRFLEKVRAWGKKILFVVNKIDILPDEDAIQKVTDFVAQNAQRLLGVTPVVFPISARWALRARETGDRAVLAGSRFPALERYIRETLDEAGRFRLKLLNPLGVGRRLANHYREAVEAELALLAADREAIDGLERQLALYEADVRRDFRLRLSEMDNWLHEMEKRGRLFFDETLRLARLFDLMKKERVQKAFAEQVVADTPERIETAIEDLIDWLVDQDLRQWQAVTGYLEAQVKAYEDRLVGPTGALGGALAQDRRRLLESVGQAARRTIAGYDREAEAAMLAETAQRAVAESALFEVGAVGLGTLLTLVLTSTAADLTGLAAAGTVALMGFLVIPTRRRQAKARLEEKVGQLRRRLVQELTHHFEREFNHSLQRIRDAVAPYTRFVRAETARLEAQQARLAEIVEALQALQVEVERWKG